MFININDDVVINTDEIQKIERFLFDVEQEDFEEIDKKTKETFQLDYRSYLLARIYFKNGETRDIDTIIYPEETTELINQINRNWEDLIVHLNSEEVDI